MAALQIVQVLLKRRHAPHIHEYQNGYNCSSFAKILEYKKCYKILGIAEDSDQEDIRAAYLNLVKKYHPDSGTPDADANKFFEIDRAFKILIHKKSKERWDVPEDAVEEQDIKHTAPQHRQYLSYEGIGVGTPFQRQKQYSKFRAIQAAENVLQHRVAKVASEEGALVDKSATKHKIKTKYGLERLVEDLIQESMSKGEFTNLSGAGKPLPNHQNWNPYVDFVTHKLNEVLIDNGFSPEWIMLHKEIKEEVQKLRKTLKAERSYLGVYPLNAQEEAEWNEIVARCASMTQQINKKIAKFNLVVPILNKQMVHVDVNKEARKILVNGEHGRTRIIQRNKHPKPQTGHDFENMFSFIESLFKK